MQDVILNETDKWRDLLSQLRISTLLPFHIIIGGQSHHLMVRLV